MDEFGSIVGAVIGTLLVLVPLWRVCGRAGFPSALSLLILVPGIGVLIVLCVLAFATWPKGEA